MYSQGSTTINTIRAREDREYAAECLLNATRTKARFIRSIPPADIDEAVTDVVETLLKDWEAGEPLSELFTRIGHRLNFRGISYYRKEQRRPLLSMDTPLGSGDGTCPVDLLVSQEASVEEAVLAREKLATLNEQIEALECYLANSEDERLKIVHSLALQGHARKDIANALDDAGLPTKPDNVHQIIKRKLRDKFPELSFLWDQQES